MKQNKRVKTKSGYISTGSASNWSSISVAISDHVPSWRVYDTGSANLSMKTYTKKPDSVSVIASESYTKDKGRHVLREVMLTLERDAAIAIRDFLNEHYPTGGNND